MSELNKNENENSKPNEKMDINQDTFLASE